MVGHRQKLPAAARYASLGLYVAARVIQRAKVQPDFVQPGGPTKNFEQSISKVALR